jgi:formylglycine-generating enzyme required for sulfatase activity
MHGDVDEWIEDDYQETYEKAPTDGSAWVDNPRVADRVVRGGSWLFEAGYCRSAARGNDKAGERKTGIGFRLAKSVGPGT